MGNVLVVTEHMKGEFQDISLEMLAGLASLPMVEAAAQLSSGE